MRYEESEIVELKREINEDLKNEIVAFLNSYLGGTIYVGVDDNGYIMDLKKNELDKMESTIINWIRDEAIYPNCSEYVKIGVNEDDVLAINIRCGKNKPYYLKNKGLKPSGVYIRYGRNKSMASEEEIARMINERSNTPFESLNSNDQDLTFKQLKRIFEDKGLDFDGFNMLTSGFISREDKRYTNLAFWLSDQYDTAVKMAVYQGTDRDIFKVKKEYVGSIADQIDRALEFFDVINEIRVIIDGKPMRTEIPSYSKRAVREVILNCFCHRDYSRNSNIKIERFDDRLEIISPGGFYDGLTLEEALDGQQSFRNKRLVEFLYRLGYIENYASGLNRVFKEYQKDENKPIINTTLNMFKVTIPNRNYEELYLHPEKHYNDNKVGRVK